MISENHLLDIPPIVEHPGVSHGCPCIGVSPGHTYLQTLQQLSARRQSARMSSLQGVLDRPVYAFNIGPCSECSDYFCQPDRPTIRPLVNHNVEMNILFTKQFFQPLFEATSCPGDRPDIRAGFSPSNCSQNHHIDTWTTAWPREMWPPCPDKQCSKCKVKVRTRQTKVQGIHKRQLPVSQPPHVAKELKSHKEDTIDAGKTWSALTDISLSTKYANSRSPDFSTSVPADKTHVDMLQQSPPGEQQPPEGVSSCEPRAQETTLQQVEDSSSKKPRNR